MTAWSANPFEMFGDIAQTEAPRDVGRAFQHERQEFAEKLFVQLVHLVIPGKDSPGAVDVLRHESVQRLFEHLAGDGGHSRQIDVRLQHRLLVELPCALGDIDGFVSDALQVCNDFQGRGDKPQVDPHRLAEGQYLKTEAVDLQLDAVHLGVPADHRLGQIGIPLGQGFQAVADLLLDQAAHLKQLLFELAQLDLVIRNRMEPIFQLRTPYMENSMDKVGPGPLVHSTRSIPFPIFL